MKCLCCNKTFNGSESTYELSVQWHKKCIKSFFGTNILPELDVSNKTIEMIAIESTNKGLTVPGVQKKYLFI